MRQENLNRIPEVINPREERNVSPNSLGDVFSLDPQAREVFLDRQNLMDELEQAPNLDRTTLMNTALSLYDRRDLNGARRLFEVLLEGDPDNPADLYNLARISYEQGNLEEALAYYESYYESLSSHPEFIESGNPGEDMPSLEETARYLGILREWVSEGERNLSETGISLYDSGDLGAAQRVFEILVERYSDKPRYLYNLATVIYEQGDVQGAISLFQRYIYLANSNEEFQENLSENMPSASQVESTIVSLLPAEEDTMIAGI